MAGIRFLLGFGTALFLVSSSAHADTTAADRTLAQSLFEQGRSLMDAKNYSAACPKFAESQRLDPSAGTLLNLAVCHERAGKLATAWAEYGDAATAARHANEQARATFADEHAKALEPKLAHMTIRVPHGAELEIKLDGAQIGSAAWGTPLPADAGPHHVVAFHDGRKTWETSMEIASDGDSATVTVPASALAAAPAESTPSPDAAAAPSAGGTNTAGWIALGIGGAGVVVGSIFGGLALGNQSTLNGDCGGTPKACPSSAHSEINTLHTNEWIADVGLGVGVVGVGIGAVLLLTSSTPEQTSTGVGLDIGPGSLGMHGRF